MKSIGLKNFQKEILFEADSSEEMFDKEREFVEIGPHSYNLKEGGEGGWDYINNLPSAEKSQYAKSGYSAMVRKFANANGFNFKDHKIDIGRKYVLKKIN